MLKYEFSIDNQEDEDLRCPVCNYYFSNVTKPYLLTCNHNLCIKCIDDMMNKKMHYCPICRKNYTSDDRKNFQVNFAFLNLVIKILKTKVIFCKKCSKIYNWTEHHSICDQQQFKETAEIMDEIKKLAEDCNMIMKYLDKHKNILQKSKRSIHETTNEIIKVVNLKFYENFNNKIDSFFENIPDLQYESYSREIFKFLDLCKGLNITDKGNGTPRSNEFIDDTNINIKKATSDIDINKNLINNKYSSNYIQSISRSSYSKKTKSFLKTRNSFMNNNTASFKNKVITDEEEECSKNSNSIVNSNFDSNKNSDVIDPEDLNEVNELRDNPRNKSNAGNVNAINAINVFSSPFNNNMNNNSNVVNFNYNFNLSDFLDDNKISSDKRESSDNSGAHKTLTNQGKSKQKIIVRNNKVEVINKKDEDKTAQNDKNESININVNTGGLYIKVNKQMKSNVVDDEEFEETNRRSKITLQTTRPRINSNQVPSSAKKLNQSAISPTNHGSITLTHHDLINHIITNFNKTKEIASKILNYTQQVEFTSETIKSQISSNFSHLSDTINSNLASLYDNITTNFTMNHKRHLVNFIEFTKKIWLFDVRKMKCEIREFVDLKFRLKANMSVEFDDNDLIFLTGGKISNSGLFSGEDTFSNLFLILRWTSRQVELQSQMPRTRANHSSVFFNSKLYVIGGITNDSQNGKLKECECYNIIDKRWELMPSMNLARCNASLCIYNNKYLYAFGGWSNENHLQTIEFLDVHNITNGWSLIKPEDPGLCWSGISFSASTVFSQNKILICGGMSSFNNKFNSSTFIFDPLKKTIFRSKDLLRPAMFNTHGTIYENNLIIIDYKNESNKCFGVHIYNTETHSWKFNQN